MDVITATQADEILDAVIAASESPVTPERSIEVELRFYEDVIITERHRHFREIGASAFERVRKALMKETKDVVYTSESIDYDVGGVRRTLYPLTAVAPPTPPKALPGLKPRTPSARPVEKKLPTGREILQYRLVTLKKSHISPYPLDLEAYPIRVDVSTEQELGSETVTGAEVTLTAGATTIRRKPRQEFRLYASAEDPTKWLINVHLTKVQQTEKGTTRVKWEIEAEIHGAVTSTSLTALNRTGIFLMKLIHDTHLLYTLEEKRNVIDTYNRILEGDPGDRMDNKVLVQARNLKRKDCVWGGLLGSEIEVKVRGKDVKKKVRYAATPKADGIRKQAMFLENGLWLVYPPAIVARLTDTPVHASLMNTILDGENIPPEKRKNAGKDIKTEYFYVPFDLMAQNGNRAIQEEDLMDSKNARLDRLNAIVAKALTTNHLRSALNMRTGTIPIYVESKPFFPLGPTVEALEATITKVQALLPTLNYETDGEMMTPIEVPYNPGSDAFPLYDRTLTVRPDTCKQKPWNHLDIDFLIRWTSPTTGMLYVNEEIKEHGLKPYTRLTPWTGSAVYPLDPATQVDWKHPLLKDVPSETIVQFGPQKVGTTLMLVPVVLRPEKPFPNRREIADDVWEDINRPLTADDLEGKTLTLAIQYHNRIKYELFQEIPKGVDTVDIGSGAGGTLARQKYMNRILAIEPNKKNAEEYKRRAAKRKMLDRIRLLEIGGEDSKAIIEAATEWFGWTVPTDPKWRRPRPLYITMMLSLSFFWKDRELLEGLAATLKGLQAAYTAAGGVGNVYFYYLTINGPAVRAVVEKEGRNHFTLGNGRFDFTPPNQLHVHIADSIVTEQDEYLVNLPDLEKAANLHAMVIHPATEEKFLSRDEMIYTSMYAYGTAIIGPVKPSSKGPPSARRLPPAKRPPGSKERKAPSPAKLPAGQFEKPIREQFTPVPQMTAETKAGLQVLQDTDPFAVDASSIGAGYSEELPGVAIVSKGDDSLHSLGSVMQPDSTSVIVIPKDVEYLRVATLDEGNSFFHSLLKMTHPAYNRVGATQRLKMAAQMRQDLVKLLSKENKGNYPDEKSALALYGGKDPRKDLPAGSIGASLPLTAYYYTLVQGDLHRMMSSVTFDDGTRILTGYDYLKVQLESMRDLPSYMFGFITEIIYVNLNVYKQAADGLELINSSPSVPPPVMRKGVPLIWKRPTLCLLELDDYVYQPIAYRPLKSAKVPGALAFNFDSKAKTFT